jgi:hypothetical protein
MMFSAHEKNIPIPITATGPASLNVTTINRPDFTNATFHVYSKKKPDISAELSNKG